MRLAVSLSLLVFLFGGACASDDADDQATAGAALPAVLPTHPAFGAFTGTLVLEEVGGSVFTINPARAKERFAPCSTYKIPNTLIGLETGVIPDADFVVPWDGVKRWNEAWNKDVDLRTAIRVSSLPFYQEVARRIGIEAMQRHVDAIGYGNRDLSGGLTEFWLGSSLTISAEEQVDFLKRLHAAQLPFSERSRAIVLDVITQRRDDTLTYRGKTGSSGDGTDRDLGWWVGSIERDRRLYVFAANMSGKGARGPLARTAVERILTERGLL